MLKCKPHLEFRYQQINLHHQFFLRFRPKFVQQVDEIVLSSFFIPLCFAKFSENLTAYKLGNSVIAQRGFTLTLKSVCSPCFKRRKPV